MTPKDKEHLSSDVAQSALTMMEKIRALSGDASVLTNLIYDKHNDSFAVVFSMHLTDPPFSTELVQHIMNSTKCFLDAIVQTAANDLKDVKPFNPEVN